MIRRRPLAVIDVGSNSIRSLVVDMDGEGAPKVLDDQREVVRLASGLRRRGRLSRKAMRRAIEALKRMADIARARGARRVAVVGTSAIREASNRRQFIERVRAETGLGLRVISEEEEARLAFESAALSFDLGNEPCAVIDLGGGSAELILAFGKHVQEAYSLRLGAVTLTERYLTSDPIRGRELARLQRHVRRRLRAGRIEADPAPRVLIASGGTATTLAQIVMARQGLEGRPVLGFEMTQAELLHLLSAMLRRTLAERRQMPGLSPERADIIVAGAAVLYEIMARLKINLLRVNERGIRHALLHRMIARKASPAKAPATAVPQRVAAAEAFGKTLRFEERHALQVKRIAESLFDQMAKPLDLDPAGRDLLSAAALLHDVGYVVSYRQHHKHAYQLIAHARLEGFTPRERELIALIARYHRRGAPKKRHRPYAVLLKDDRRLVARLASILRLADALDRRHSQRLREVRCRVIDDTVRLVLRSERDLMVEAHAAEEKSDLFGDVFGRDVVVTTRTASKGESATATPPLRLVRKAAGTRTTA
ncbi:MAG TPA: Ppx/GppA phosphatase family protein [Candidatus Polarisedimenticolia bacterium]|nr:Ppx/GppA phosphatase family protein [Candidatus Polarisedimenticolia bacterium]